MINGKSCSNRIKMRLKSRVYTTRSHISHRNPSPLLSCVSSCVGRALSFDEGKSLTHDWGEIFFHDTSEKKRLTTLSVDEAASWDQIRVTIK